MQGEAKMFASFSIHENELFLYFRYKAAGKLL